MHRDIGLELINKNYLEKVIYTPVGNNYNKKDLINFKHRYEMIKLMIEKYKDLELSDYELNNTLTYTYQTLTYFKSIYPNDEIYFICGSDNLKEINTWKNYKYILENYKILVIKRNNDNLADILMNINSQNIVVADIELDNISSTYIRDLINNLELNKYLDSKVLKYIKENKLY